LIRFRIFEEDQQLSLGGYQGDRAVLKRAGDGIISRIHDRVSNATTGAAHSSLHSTISVPEGILEYENNGPTYRLKEVMGAGEQAQKFILQHRLFRSDRIGAVVDKKMLMLSYPSRWR
jgi:hypothetical protein